jgi:DNA-damage-inducible protein D
MEDNKITVFESKNIRREWHDEEWYFSVVDVIEALTDSPIPRNYWSLLKKREPQLHTTCMQLKLKSADGKSYKTDCANTEGVFRIIMSVPSPKAEPFKLWLAQVGRERMEEFDNPELGFERMVELYKAKGYSDDWIIRRVESIKARNRLTDEWKNRGVKEGQEYSFLTAIIAKNTFDVTPAEHKKIKGLDKPSQNLRDHMTPLELIFTALGEELTRSEAIKDDAQGFHENQDAAVKGGSMAGKARKMIENERSERIVSSENYLNQLKESGEKKGLE